LDGGCGASAEAIDADIDSRDAVMRIEMLYATMICESIDRLERRGQYRVNRSLVAVDDAAGDGVNGGSLSITVVLL
jgi:hypothetical protein